MPVERTETDTLGGAAMDFPHAVEADGSLSAAQPDQIFGIAQRSPAAPQGD
ncbi:hypothetical protein [Pararhizobium sp. LjRoot238]|uniref:hypothetical protein n=1 Tax=Pararhizobium sp. LjRoot238 TaxID=3342293 RepID=UPI003ECEAD31